MVFVRDGIRERFGRRQTVAGVHATGLALDEAALHQHRNRALRSTGLLARRNCIEGGEGSFRESFAGMSNSICHDFRCRLHCGALLHDDDLSVIHDRFSFTAKEAHAFAG
jgi:hypothetical protein